MSIGTVITLIAAVLGSSTIAAIITAFVNSKRNRSQSETEARSANTAEFNAIVAANKDQMDRMKKDISDLKAEVYDIRAVHQSAEDYIDLLMAGIYNGTIPPIPPRHKTP